MKTKEWIEFTFCMGMVIMFILAAIGYVCVRAGGLYDLYQ